MLMKSIHKDSDQPIDPNQSGKTGGGAVESFDAYPEKKLKTGGSEKGIERTDLIDPSEGQQNIDAQMGMTTEEDAPEGVDLNGLMNRYRRIKDDKRSKKAHAAIYADIARTEELAKKLAQEIALREEELERERAMYEDIRKRFVSPDGLDLVMRQLGDKGKYIEELKQWSDELLKQRQQQTVDAAGSGVESGHALVLADPGATKDDAEPIQLGDDTQPDVPSEPVVPNEGMDPHLADDASVVDGTPPVDGVDAAQIPMLGEGEESVVSVLTPTPDDMTVPGDPNERTPDVASPATPDSHAPSLLPRGPVVPPVPPKKPGSPEPPAGPEKQPASSERREQQLDTLETEWNRIRGELSREQVELHKKQAAIGTVGSAFSWVKQKLSGAGTGTEIAQAEARINTLKQAGAKLEKFMRALEGDFRQRDANFDTNPRAYLAEGYRKLGLGWRNIEPTCVGLTSSQMLLARHNLEQATLGRVESEATDAVDQKTQASGFLGKIWRSAFKGIYTAHQAKRTAEEILVGGMEVHGEVLGQIAEAAKKGPRVHREGDGRLVFDFAAPGEGAFRDAGTADAFNVVANRFMKVPKEWSYASATETERKEYLAAESEYEQMMTQVFGGVYAQFKGGQADRGAESIRQISAIEYQLKMQQLFNTHPEAESELMGIIERSPNKKFFSDAMRQLRAEDRGLYFAAGFAVRSVIVNWAGLVAAPLVGGFMGYRRGSARSVEEMKHQDKMRRDHGNHGQENIAQMRKDIAEMDARLASGAVLTKDERKRRREMEERLATGEHMLQGSDAIGKLNILMAEIGDLESVMEVDALRRNTQGWEAFCAGRNLTDRTRTAGAEVYLRRLRARLNSRTRFTREKYDAGKIEFDGMTADRAGKPGEKFENLTQVAAARMAQQYRLMDALGMAQAEAEWDAIEQQWMQVDESVAKQKDEHMRPKKPGSKESWSARSDRRLEALLEGDQQLVTNAREQHRKSAARRGMLYGAGFALAGAGLSHLIAEWRANPDFVSDIEKKLHELFHGNTSPGAPVVIPVRPAVPPHMPTGAPHPLPTPPGSHPPHVPGSPHSTGAPSYPVHGHGHAPGHAPGTATHPPLHHAPSPVHHPSGLPSGHGAHGPEVGPHPVEATLHVNPRSGSSIEGQLAAHLRRSGYGHAEAGRMAHEELRRFVDEYHLTPAELKHLDRIQEASMKLGADGKIEHLHATLAGRGHHVVEYGAGHAASPQPISETPASLRAEMAHEQALSHQARSVSSGAVHHSRAHVGVSHHTTSGVTPEHGTVETDHVSDAGRVIEVNHNEFNRRLKEDMRIRLHNMYDAPHDPAGRYRFTQELNDKSVLQILRDGDDGVLAENQRRHLLNHQITAIETLGRAGRPRIGESASMYLYRTTKGMLLQKVVPRNFSADLRGDVLPPIY